MTGGGPEPAEQRPGDDALDQQLRQQQDILDAAPANIYVKSLDGRYQFANRGLLERLHLSAEQIIGRTDQEVFGSQSDRWRANDHRALQGTVHDVEVVEGPPASVYRSTKFPLLGADGTPYAICGISLDVTEAHRSEQSAQAAQRRVEELERVDTLGRFASGLAHDLRNQLAAVRGMVELALDDASGLGERLRAGPKGAGEAAATLDRLEQGLRDAHAAVLRSTGQVQQMLSATQPHDTQPRPLPIQTLVEWTRPLLAQALGGRRLLEQVPADTPSVLADPDDVERVLLNLVTNAAEAVPAGATVVVSASVQDVPDPLEDFLPEVELPPGPYVRLDVVDDGPGMDATVSARAVQPLFTTKSGGSGLGLWLAHSLALRNHGALTLWSEPGRGARVSLWLPVAP